MRKEEISLQLTLKAIDRMAISFSGNSSAKCNKEFSKQVCEFYNYLNNNLNCYSANTTVDGIADSIEIL